MIEQKKAWLAAVGWDAVANVNRTLCQAQKLEPKVNAKTFAKVQAEWEKARQKPVTFLEALDICHRAFEQSPFTFNNGNTFANIARGLVDDSLREAPPVEAQILRNTISHYVAGTIRRKEVEQVLRNLGSLLSRSPAPVRTAAPDVATPRLAGARPMASSS